MFKCEELEYLRECKSSLDSVCPEELKKRWEGNNAAIWFERVKNSKTWLDCIKSSSDSNSDIVGLSDRPLDRYVLIERISKSKSSEPISDNTLKRSVIEIFAWGGMRTDHASKAILCFENYRVICEKLVSSELDAIEAYKEFFVADHSKELEGMGPAYYTKLIYFLGDQSGLILDQWTGRSINLLCENPVIHLDNPIGDRKAVSKSNGPNRYAAYLEIVEKLREELEMNTLSETEELIFSCSDRKGKNRFKAEKYHDICSAWRKYVRTNGKERVLDEMVIGQSVLQV